MFLSWRAIPRTVLRTMAKLMLQDGTVFEGESFGAPVDSEGEVVFTTGMVGYPESLTDPSYRGQILVFTYPLIGNYGVPSEELNEWGFSKNFESEGIHVRGVVVAQASEYYSHHAAVESFPAWLKRHGIPGITGVDTRALVKKLREKGVMLGAIQQDAKDERDARERYSLASFASLASSASSRVADPNLRNLVAEVSCKEVITYEPTNSVTNNPITILAFDCGMKRGILRSFLARGARVIRVPGDYDIDACAEKFDGVFISNGPGDPKKCEATIRQIQKAIGRNIPTFGVCLGNQLMALAAGADTYKMTYGHRGMNQPCIEVTDGTEGAEGTEIRLEATSVPSVPSSPSVPSYCIITSQNHGYAVREDSLPKDWRVWFRNANDGTIEGIRHASGRFAAVQFHPEATPGPEDAGYLFDEFLRQMYPSTCTSSAGTPHCSVQQRLAAETMTGLPQM